MAHRDAHSEVADLDNEERRCPLCVQWFVVCLNPLVLCPEPVWYLKCFTIFVMACLFWLATYSIFQSEFLPDKILFQLVALGIFGYIAGLVISVIKLPPLFGMLLVGIVMENRGYVDFTEQLKQAVPIIRHMALVIILIKVGMFLDAETFKSFKFIVFKLALIPGIVETVTVCLLGSFMSLPWEWGLLIGFVQTALSPSIVLPPVLVLQGGGYGEDVGIAATITEALSVCNVASISGFGMVLGVLFASGDLTERIIHGPEEIVIGTTCGIVWGFLIWYFPHKDDPAVVFCRSFLLGIGSVIAIIGSQIMGYTGAGPLACLTAAFVANSGWKMMGWPRHNAVVDVFSAIWEVFQPLLFGLIGAGIRLSNVKLLHIQYAFVVTLFGLLVRIPATFFSCLGASLNFKEKVFICFCWIPKGTIQGALGPVALDVALSRDDDDAITYAQLMLTIVVISISITAPLGALLIYFGGPCLLTKWNVYY